ncbi:MAG TPA: hypothetical protein VJT74_08295 [Pyrinomonadaceae bacterium]|nr:hypothetical protein [Pyrinomonadaceae bacterium]
MIVEGPSPDAPTSVLLSHEGSPAETVDADLENARLSEETTRENEVDPRAAMIPGPISYATRDGGQGRAPDYSRACGTTIEVLLPPDNKAPSRIHFFQTSGRGGETYRDLDIRADDAELVVSLSINPPESPPGDVDDAQITEDDGPGCVKLIKGARWARLLGGAFGFKSLVAANSKFNFRFMPLPPTTPLWQGQNGFFEPFTLGPPGLRAREVSIRTLNGPATLEVRSADEDMPLRINSLKVGSDQLQVGLTGKGFVKIDGEDITVDFFERIKKYPLLAGLLLMANAALLTWLIRLARGLFPRRP